MEDKTFELMANEQKKQQGQITFISAPEYNIDDMDIKFCMVSLNYSGCFCLRSTKIIDKSKPGMVDIDGKPTEAPLIESPNSMFGQIVAIHVRKYLSDYDRAYKIRYYGAFDTDGQPLPEFTFDLKTFPKVNPGEQYPEHDERVLRAAREGMVLLKNEGDTLPLKNGSTVNAFGAGSVVFRSGCLGAGKINPRYSIRLKDGLKYTSLVLNEELYEFYRSESNKLPDEGILKRAKEKSQTAIIFISRCSSEAHEMPLAKGGYYLTDDEKNLIASCKKHFKKCVVILNTAYPIEMGWIDGVDAIIWTGLCGMAGGRALAEILEGKVNPSGRLPNTWAYDYYDYPSASNFITKEDILKEFGDMSVKYSAVVYEEGVYVGYRYFTSFNKKAAYLFGHGLSYTQFKTKIAKCAVDSRYNAQIAVEVSNTGKRSGKHVLAVYAQIKGVSEQPERQLVAFAKTKELNVGESQTLTLDIPANRFSVYSVERQSRVIESGEVTLYLGGTPADCEQIYSFKTEDTLIKKSKNLFTVPVCFEDMSVSKPFKSANLTRAYRSNELSEIPYKVTVGYKKHKEAAKTYTGKTITFDDIVNDNSLLDNFIAQLDDYQLARLCVGGKTGWGVGDKGYAGSIERGGRMEEFKLSEYIFADGNNGLNLNDANIGYPTSNLMCASWNTELMEEEGRTLAKEARDRNLNCILAPAMNIQRNPLCGRHSEYFSEDPLLAGMMSGSQAKGFEEGGLSACVKHFFGNNCELMRSETNSIMSERCARDIYLRAFEYSFETHMPDTVMTSYNAVNGVYCCANEVLLRDYLRDELGFNGFVMTDWNGYGDEGFSACLKAGVNWLAPGSPDDSIVNPVVDAIKNGSLSKSLMQRNAKEIVAVMIKYFN